jgi:hypothetical protein
MGTTQVKTKLLMNGKPRDQVLAKSLLCGTGNLWRDRETGQMIVTRLKLSSVEEERVELLSSSKFYTTPF